MAEHDGLGDEWMSDSELDDQILDADLWELTHMLTRGHIKAEPNPGTGAVFQPMRDIRRVFGSDPDTRPFTCHACNLRHSTREEAMACCDPSRPMPDTVLERITRLVLRGAGPRLISEGLGVVDEAEVAPVVSVITGIYQQERGLTPQQAKRASHRAMHNKRCRWTEDADYWPPRSMTIEQMVEKVKHDLKED